MREEKEQRRVAMAGQGGIKAVTEANGVKEKVVSGKNSFASGLAPDKKRSLRKDDGAERNEHEEGDKEEESEDNEELSTDNANKTDAAAPGILNQLLMADLD